MKVLILAGGLGSCLSEETTLKPKPMVAFDVGIHKETIVHRKNGCLIKSGDFNSFANELNFLKNHPEEANIIGMHGYELYKELTSEEMFKNKLKTIFK